VTTANKQQPWAIIRLATLQKKGDKDRLLFTTVTELAAGRPPLPDLEQPEDFPLKGSPDRLRFRRIALPKDAAVDWYIELAEGEKDVPIPLSPNQTNANRWSFSVPRLKVPQPWPVLGLPFSEGGLFQSHRASIKQAPFIGSVPARLHQKFGNRAGLDAFLDNPEAVLFLARRMHIDLSDFQEYLGSAVYIAPDQIVRQIDHFMVPAQKGKGERIFYRLVPRPGQRLDGLSLTTFDKEVHLLTRFETHTVPTDGIVVLDKGTCYGEYGFVLTHEELGVLAYSPPASFLRQMNLSIQIPSRRVLNVQVPTGNAPDAPRVEYQAEVNNEWESSSQLGDAIDVEAGTRVAMEARKRERQANAELLGQRWFSAGSRTEAMEFIQDLLRPARSRVIVADPYLGTLQLGQFLYAVSARQVQVTLLTTALAFKPGEGETKQAVLTSFQKSLEQLKEHRQLDPRVVVISDKQLHDRFLVVDDDVWFVGNSLNGLGEKASMIVRLPDPLPVTEQLQKLIASGEKLDRYIRKVNRDSARSGQS